MTTDEFIKKYKEILAEYTKTYKPNFNPRKNELYKKGFEGGWRDGAMWSDKNPNWHKYPDEKPKKTDRYLIAFYWPEFNRNEVAEIYYNMVTDTWGITDQQTKHWKIFAWMKKPEPPKFD